VLLLRAHTKQVKKKVLNEGLPAWLFYEQTFNLLLKSNGKKTKENILGACVL
jgi:hypothetical protein